VPKLRRDVLRENLAREECGCGEHGGATRRVMLFANIAASIHGQSCRCFVNERRVWLTALPRFGAVSFSPFPIKRALRSGDGPASISDAVPRAIWAKILPVDGVFPRADVGRRRPLRR